jgi:two-component sensor histidine kinase
MAPTKPSVFLLSIERLSKSKAISDGNIHEITQDILHEAARLLRVERVNAWIMDDKESGLDSILAFDHNDKKFYKEGSLKKKDLPIYFEHIAKNDIIISEDAASEKFNIELVQTYLIPHDVASMMEVPIISEGKLKGIICFENLHNIRKWTSDEQHFAIALTQLLILTIENNSKNILREQLEKLVNEKSILIAEINHRVKNNLAVITALIRSEMHRTKDNYHHELFENILAKTFSLSTLQSSMYHSKNYQEVDFYDFLKSLLENIDGTYGFGKNVQKEINGDEQIKIEVTNAIPLSLITNEVLTNSYKYAFLKEKNNDLNIILHQNEDETSITFIDNGSGLPDDYKYKGTGMELIEGLVEQIDGKLDIATDEKGTKIHISF